MNQEMFKNPYKPGAGHMPPWLAGRDDEKIEFIKLLNQDTILENAVLTGLRGVGKTVLLETFKPIAIESKWLWTGTELSESASVSEETVATRIVADLSLIASNLTFSTQKIKKLGFLPGNTTVDIKLDYETLIQIYNTTPGLVADKLKCVLEIAWHCISAHNYKGVIFAYDEAQTMSNQGKKNQYPLSLLLDVFQSIQKKDIRFMLVLAGLPTLFPQLVEARTFAERMFKIIFLDKLNDEESREAIVKPLNDTKCSTRFNKVSVNLIVKEAGGYPYFIQFICKEVYDIFIQQISADQPTSVPLKEIIIKLDRDFFAGRWSKATDRQRDLLFVIASVENSDEEFSVQDIVEKSRELLDKGFSNSHVNQMLNSLSNAGLVYKNRHGKYCFAVPLLGQYILRQNAEKLKETSS